MTAIDDGRAYGHRGGHLGPRAGRGRRRHPGRRAAAPLLAPGRTGRRRRPRSPATSGCSARTSCCTAAWTATPGLMYPRCCHRGTTLYFGQVEDDGIRCPYHGWLFAADGQCLDQPCEPDRGRNRASYRQPWYPVVEYHGLVFAYLGPADKQPVFPRYDIFEDLDVETEEIVIIDHFAFGGPSDAPCNWFQTHENAMDPYHVFILHNAISGPQFDPKLEIWPRIDWQRNELGITATQDRELPDGTTLHRITEVRMPDDPGHPDADPDRAGQDQQPVVGAPDRRDHDPGVRHGPQAEGSPATGAAGLRRRQELVRPHRRRAPALSRATTRPRSARARSRCTARSGCRRPTGACRWSAGSSRSRCSASPTASTRSASHFDEADALQTVIAGNYIVGPDTDPAHDPVVRAVGGVSDVTPRRRRAAIGTEPRTAHVAEHGIGRVPARCAEHPGARERAGSRQVQPVDRRPVPGRLPVTAEQGTQRRSRVRRRVTTVHLELGLVAIGRHRPPPVDVGACPAPSHRRGPRASAPARRMPRQPPSSAVGREQHLEAQHVLVGVGLHLRVEHGDGTFTSNVGKGATRPVRAGRAPRRAAPGSARSRSSARANRRRARGRRRGRRPDTSAAPSSTASTFDS